MESIDKLRKVVRKVAEEHAHITDAHMESLIDAIEKELAERYVELPKDADGEYICAGDDVEWMNGTKQGRVTGIGVGERDGWVWVLMEGKNVSIALLASKLHHCRSDSWESIIADAYMRGAHEQYIEDGRVVEVSFESDYDLVERCKALAKEGA